MFDLFITDKAVNQLKKLKYEKGLVKHYKAVRKAFKLLQSNPKHPGLQTHKFYTIKGPDGEEIFEAYAEQHTSSAYRIFFYYGPGKRAITIVSIVPHPD
ncbi:MAG: hypothetical protein GWP03_06055 [Proteobacteria bacterium]|nr:hypothetical protein [Pseudomonadota bacterium]